MSEVHPAAAEGFQAGAETYERGRPGYPEALQSWLRGSLGLEPGRACLDLGAGTGKFTRLLARTGASVTAVEPVPAMRARLQASLPGVRALAGTAQALPLPDAELDAVVCAQAFHWFADAQALAEVRRVLRPGGRFGLVWNVRDESVDWVAEITRLLEPYEGDAPRYRTGRWREPFAAARFTPLEMTTLEHRHVGPARTVILERCLSISFIARLPEAERSRLEARLEALVARHPDLRGRAEVAFPYQTCAYCCARLD